jgi:hypothetical protein
MTTHLSRSARVLVAAATAVGLFEACSVLPNSKDSGLGGALLTAGFAAVFLVAAALVARRGSLAAATVAGVLLLVDLAGLPFYARTSVTDWVVDTLFGVVSTAGVVAWVGVLRERRAGKALVHA